MVKKVDDILKQVLEEIKPSEKELLEIRKELDNFLIKLEKEIKKRRVNVEVFVGGSFAKNTLMKKDFYDIDIFLRFDKKIKEDLSELTEKLLKVFKNVSRVHGSRDYFGIKVKKNLIFEIVPVLKVNKPENSLNITDLSYSHVKYINKKIKNEKLLNDILIAKAFCFANDCYGAESYIHGFSGYGLELLVYHYGGFIKFLRAMIKINNKEIIDIEKFYKRKNNILLDLNSSKLDSPIILIDPTYKQRNALAALSYETFEKFQKVAKKFLKYPSIRLFEKKIIDYEKIKKQAKTNKQEFVFLKISTNKQQGDIAGSKMLKFYNLLSNDISNYFNIKDKNFNYENGQTSKAYFVVKSKKEILLQGPFVNDKKNIQRFKKSHKKTFVKKNQIYSKKVINFSLKKFLIDWKQLNKNKIKDMSIKKLEVF